MKSKAHQNTNNEPLATVQARTQRSIAVSRQVPRAPNGALPQLQSTHGNRAVQRFLEPHLYSSSKGNASTAVQRQVDENEGESAGLWETLSQIGSIAHGATEFSHAMGLGHHMPGGGLSNLAGPLGLAAGGYELYHNLSAPHMNLQNTAGAVAGAAEAASGAVGTVGLLGSITGSAGMAGTAASLGPAAAVLGAGAAGYGLGSLIEEHTHIGSRAGDLAFDALGPEPGLWLADHLPSWLQ